MTVPWDVVVAATATVAAALFGVLVGGWVTARSQNSQWTRTARLEAYTGFLRAYGTVYHELGVACWAGRRMDAHYWGPWNQGLGVVALAATPDVVKAAVAVDAAMWHVSQEMRRGAVGGDAWLTHREPIERAYLSFMNAARRELVAGSDDIETVLGRPSEEDPVWHSDSVTARQVQPESG
jgi:hypothetical protein